jgi:hypothetical protein
MVILDAVVYVFCPTKVFMWRAEIESGLETGLGE